MPLGIPSCRRAETLVSVAPLFLPFRASTASYWLKWKRMFVLLDAAYGAVFTGLSVKR
jgi:hypothetical protein